MTTRRIKLWDFPTRLFHWLLVLLITAAVITGKIGGDDMMKWHGRVGLGILGLLSFRIVWGLAGSTYARFVNFMPTPGSVIRYIKGQWLGVGHNPLGAFSVIGLLALTALQVLTGLFSNDEIAFKGPLYRLVDAEFSNQLAGVHATAINVLLGLITLHVCAIAFYTLVKKDNLLQPMISGWKEIAPERSNIESAKGGGTCALIIALIIAAAAVYAGSGVWISSAAPPSEKPQETQKKFDW